jgi:hypothetical protein
MPGALVDFDSATACKNGGITLGDKVFWVEHQVVSFVGRLSSDEIGGERAAHRGSRKGNGR